MPSRCFLYAAIFCFLIAAFYPWKGYLDAFGWPSRSHPMRAVFGVGFLILLLLWIGGLIA